MNKVLQHSLVIGSAALGVVLAGSAAKAEQITSLDQLTQYSREGQAAQGQVTSVSQLSDVKPTDWAFQALQSLVERYGCIAGYPDRTYRGNRALTRYEFAAGLNACLDRVNELIAAATSNLVKKEDLATLQKLQEQFAAELATLRGRVDALDSKVATLEKQQFSTTTKLAGEVQFAVSDEFSARGIDDRGNNTVFQDRVRLSLNTSFTGKDLLVTRLAAGNGNRFQDFQSGAVNGGDISEGQMTVNTNAGGGNGVAVDWLAYYGNYGEKIKFYIPATGGLHYDYAPTAAGAMDAGDGGTGPLSLFAQRNPIYGIGGGSGIGANFDLGGGLTLSGGYLADNANSPNSTGANKGGLFGAGGSSTLAQIAYAPTNSPFQLALTYVSAFSRGAIFDGTTAIGIGSPLANAQVDGFGNNLGLSSKTTALGASAAFKVSPQLVVNGFVSRANVNFLGDNQGNQKIWTYGAGIALPDFGKQGNLLGIMVGAEPYRAGGRSAANTRVGRSIPFHVEGFYKYQLNDKVSVTPGLIWVTNPGQNSSNEDALIGTVRTTFTF
ncbi:MAG: iron uptake porin [Alkalinema sp. RU_4_3]|nr:iron uptake porin [Alkalinema sp. RU_4_3]